MFIDCWQATCTAINMIPVTIGERQKTGEIAGKPKSKIKHTRTNSGRIDHDYQRGLFGKAQNAA